MNPRVGSNPTTPNQPKGDIMICPIHRHVIHDFDKPCPTCEMLGIKVLSVEYDKQNRAHDTMILQGYTFDSNRSKAIMIFNKPKN